MHENTCLSLFRIYNILYSTASGDPHILLYINGVDQPICFDYYGADKDIIQLVQDDSLGNVNYYTVFISIDISFSIKKGIVAYLAIKKNTKSQDPRLQKHLNILKI